MTLLELCEPLFLYICRLNRFVRKGTNWEYSQIRAEVEAIFEQMRSTAGQEPGLAEQYDKMELPLIFFADSVISEMPIPAAATWHKNRMAFERKELAGDEKFWDLLDGTLEEKSAAATERVAVFYVCIGLGFAGFYAGQPEYLRKRMLECSARISKMMDADQAARICPEAYEHVNTSNLIEPPGKKLVGIALAVAGLLVTLFFANLYLFRSASRDLREALTSIRKSEGAAREQDGKALPAEGVTTMPAEPRGAKGVEQ